MTPAEIVTNVIRMSINENAPDTALETVALGFVNDAYKDVYTAIAEVNNNWLAAEQTITLSNTTGQATLSPVPLKLLRAYDVTTKNRLYATTWDEVNETLDPQGTGRGVPQYYYIKDRSTFVAWPFLETGTNQVRVRYIPSANTLLLTSAESDIKIPPEFHIILQWGAMKQMGLYERGFTNTELMGFAAASYQEQMTKLMNYLSTEAKPPMRVKGHYM